jgi:hypothetical protein
MRKIYLPILALAVSLSFCACGTDDMGTGTSDGTKAPSTSKVTDRVTERVTDEVTVYETIPSTDDVSDTVNDGDGGGLPEIVTDAVSDIRGFFGRMGNK